jgi:hypothetical protein
MDGACEQLCYGFPCYTFLLEENICVGFGFFQVSDVQWPCSRTAVLLSHLIQKWDCERQQMIHLSIAQHMSIVILVEDLHNNRLLLLCRGVAIGKDRRDNQRSEKGEQDIKLLLRCEIAWKGIFGVRAEAILQVNRHRKDVEMLSDLVFQLVPCHVR